MAVVRQYQKITIIEWGKMTMKLHITQKGLKAQRYEAKGTRGISIGAKKMTIHFEGEKIHILQGDKYLMVTVEHDRKRILLKACANYRKQKETYFYKPYWNMLKEAEEHIDAVGYTPILWGVRDSKPFTFS